jgi:hypothetical protein
MHGEDMKLLSTLMLIILIPGTASAQSALDDQIELVRKAHNTDRQAVIMGNMHFTAEESADFWPAWRQYRAAIAANGDRKVALIKDFVENYENMTDIRADRLMTDSFSIQMQDLVIKQNFAKEINKFMPAQKVMRVIQIESKLDAAIQMQLAAEIPLAK